MDTQTSMPSSPPLLSIKMNISERLSALTHAGFPHPKSASYSANLHQLEQMKASTSSPPCPPAAMVSCTSLNALMAAREISSPLPC
nr:hypothetical protein Itr_chr04CG02820 [Ipomoea trifida]